MCDLLETAVNEIESTEIFNNNDINYFLDLVNTACTDLVNNKTEFEKLQELIKTLNTNLCILYNNDKERINELYNKYILRI